MKKVTVKVKNEEGELVDEVKETAVFHKAENLIGKRQIFYTPCMKHVKQKVLGSSLVNINRTQPFLRFPGGDIVPVRLFRCLDGYLFRFENSANSRRGWSSWGIFPPIVWSSSLTPRFGIGHSLEAMISLGSSPTVYWISPMAVLIESLKSKRLLRPWKKSSVCCDSNVNFRSPSTPKVFIIDVALSHFHDFEPLLFQPCLTCVSRRFSTFLLMFGHGKFSVAFPWNAIFQVRSIQMRMICVKKSPIRENEPSSNF